MGIFDFLGDLSSKRSKELGLGGLQSLLGTRGAAQAGAIGDEMIGITNKDSLPGYFNEQTREYVPWYVDLFDGGGLNKSEGLLASDAQKAPSAVDMLKTNGAPVQRASQMAPGPLEPFGGAGPRIANGDPRNLGGASGYGQTGVSPLDPFGGAGPAIPAPRTPELPRVREITTSGQLIRSEGGDLYRTTLPQIDSNQGMRYRENRVDEPPNIAMPEEPNMFSSDPAQVGSQVIPASGGNMAINTPAAQNRDQIIADRQAYNQEQAMKNHPLYPEYVDFLNRSGLASVPGLFEQYLKVTGAN